VHILALVLLAMCLWNLITAVAYLARGSKLLPLVRVPSLASGSARAFALILSTAMFAALALSFYLNLSPKADNAFRIIALALLGVYVLLAIIVPWLTARRRGVSLRQNAVGKGRTYNYWDNIF